MHKTFPVALGLALVACWLPAAQADLPSARLFLTIELQGAARKDLPNKVEWYRLNATRKLEAELHLMAVPSPAPLVKVGGIDKDNAPMPLSLSHKNGRFENWVADFRKQPCARGTVTVADEGDGMNISPPNPAKPYRFQRAGRMDLAAQGQEVLERVCQAELSVERDTGMMSLRLNRFDIPVPVQMSGQAYTFEKAVPFLERQGKLELFDQKVDAKAASWTGQAKVEKIGTVSHNSGQTVAPMTATVSWRFVRN